MFEGIVVFLYIYNTNLLCLSSGINKPLLDTSDGVVCLFSFIYAMFAICSTLHCDILLWLTFVLAIIVPYICSVKAILVLKRTIDPVASQGNLMQQKKDTSCLLPFNIGRCPAVASAHNWQKPVWPRYTRLLSEEVWPEVITRKIKLDGRTPTQCPHWQKLVHTPIEAQVQMLSDAFRTVSGA